MPYTQDVPPLQWRRRVVSYLYNWLCCNEEPYKRTLWLLQLIMLHRATRKGHSEFYNWLCCIEQPEKDTRSFTIDYAATSNQKRTLSLLHSILFASQKDCRPNYLLLNSKSELKFLLASKFWSSVLSARMTLKFLVNECLKLRLDQLNIKLFIDFSPHL